MRSFIDTKILACVIKARTLSAVDCRFSLFVQSFVLLAAMPFNKLIQVSSGEPLIKNSQLQ